MADRLGRLAWLREETSAGCTERTFLLPRLTGPVPGVLWSPQATAPRGTALLFHGGSGHKRSERHLRMGRRLASAGLAVIAIDGPYHGGRVPAPMTASAYQQRIADEGIETVTARMTADWLDAVSVLAGLGVADDAHVSVFGMSMGARYGLPAAAALGPRLQCAVLGKFGVRQAAGCWPPVSWRRPRTPSPPRCSTTCSGTTSSSPGTGSSSYSTRWPPPTSKTDRQGRPARPDAPR